MDGGIAGKRRQTAAATNKRGKAVFSGIIEATGRISTVEPCGGGRTLVVAAPKYWADVRMGASVAIDGVCLTVTRVRGDEASFDVIAETLRRSTLGEAGPGGLVNLQKSLTVGDRIDGHFVQGHVDALGTIAKVEQSERESIWWFSTDPEARPYIVPKGSIAIDGISLTIADVRDDLFSVALIPTTLAQTTLGQKRAGHKVNIETDVLARTVIHYLRALAARGRPAGGGLTLEQLVRDGFARNP